MLEVREVQERLAKTASHALDNENFFMLSISKTLFFISSTSGEVGP